MRYSKKPQILSSNDRMADILDILHANIREQDLLDFKDNPQDHVYVVKKKNDMNNPEDVHDSHDRILLQTVNALRSKIASFEKKIRMRRSSKLNWYWK